MKEIWPWIDWHRRLNEMSYSLSKTGGQVSKELKLELVAKLKALAKDIKDDK